MLTQIFKNALGEKIKSKLIPIRNFLLKKFIQVDGKISVGYQYRSLFNKKAEGIVNNTISQIDGTIRSNINLRETPHILFVTEKWCDCNPFMGTTNSEHNLFGSLASSGLATQARFHFDEYYYEHHDAGDIALLETCLNTSPDVVVLTWWHGKIFSFFPYNPKLETLKIIATELKIPIVAIWFDSVLSKVMMIAETVLPYVACNVILDSTVSYLGKTNHPEKYLSLWTPQDSKIFNNPKLERDIDICFLGSTHGYADRIEGITALRDNGIHVYQAGGQRENHLSVEEYASILMRSKIVLNFSYARSQNVVQAKGRIFEATLCGAMLLESENSETAKWFEPFVDYVPFVDAFDLVKQAKYYLAQEDERRAIAQRGHYKATTNYTGEIFWRIILDKTRAWKRD
ncbi:glycosyltransferase [Tumidithrix elongata RA019]|uniref:Glycosyltransferase n=1 Tax=Tumidithrix elongata BACA0141 TaxID=2716417 RepID=A0AAW9Q8G9_9CYAN|nr:glycosyltransferase [Tumidithrix elongata RA019]